VFIEVTFSPTRHTEIVFYVENRSVLWAACTSVRSGIIKRILFWACFDICIRLNPLINLTFHRLEVSIEVNIWIIKIGDKTLGSKLTLSIINTKNLQTWTCLAYSSLEIEIRWRITLDTFLSIKKRSICWA